MWTRLISHKQNKTTLITNASTNVSNVKLQTHRKGIPSTHAHLEQFSKIVEKSGFTCLHEHIINSALALAMITDETDVMQFQAEH